MPVSRRLLELEVLPGVGPLLDDELRRAGVEAGDVVAQTNSSRMIDWRAPLGAALALRLPVAAHAVRSHAVPRPKGLLGHEHLGDLLRDMATAVALWPEGAFTSFRINAAGRESSVFQRLATEIVSATGLEHRPTDGDLLVRVRPPTPEVGQGWETLVRLSPRPLSAREWRVRDLPGALNATLAAALVDMTEPARGDVVLNLMCGSGTLLIERAHGALPRPSSLVGVDVEPVADENLRAAGVAAAIVRGDAQTLPVDTSSVDVLLTDLPYGHRIGSHADNEVLYPAVMAEAARVARTGARFGVVTHEIRRFESVLGSLASHAWQLDRCVRVFQKGHRPGMWMLRRV